MLVDDNSLSQGNLSSPESLVAQVCNRRPFSRRVTSQPTSSLPQICSLCPSPVAQVCNRRPFPAGQLRNPHLLYRRLAACIHPPLRRFVTCVLFPHGNFATDFLCTAGWQLSSILVAQDCNLCLPLAGAMLGRTLFLSALLSHTNPHPNADYCDASAGAGPSSRLACGGPPNSRSGRSRAARRQKNIYAVAKE